MFGRNNNQQQRRRGGGDQNNGRKPAAAAAPVTVVGTEAAAKEHLERNRREFNYPKDGTFEVPIEHSLLYSMLKEPSVYPREVIVRHVRDEDFSQYMHYHTPASIATAKKKTTHVEGDDDEEEPLASYAQLSALLGLSAEHYPPQRGNNDGSSGEMTTTGGEENETAKADDDSDEKDVSKVLGKRVLQVVVRYATEHDLDRGVEVNDLLDPFARYVQRRNTKTELKAIGSLYAGYGAMIVTGNMLPALAGLVVYTNAMSSRENEQRNFLEMQKETRKRADVETTGLLDEADDE